MRTKMSSNSVVNSTTVQKRSVIVSRTRAPLRTSFVLIAIQGAMQEHRRQAPLVLFDCSRLASRTIRFSEVSLFFLHCKRRCKTAGILQ